MRSKARAPFRNLRLSGRRRKCPVCGVSRREEERGAFGAAETAALACAPLRTARGGLESWDAWRRTPADWALANGASDALLALRDAGARVRALASRVASAAAATRDKARDVSEWKTAKARSVLATLVAETPAAPADANADALWSAPKIFSLPFVPQMPPPTTSPYL